MPVKAFPETRWEGLSKYFSFYECPFRHAQN